MKLFTEAFKLYAYKNKDRCDLSIKVNDTFVLTFRLTHDELRRILTEYAINDPDRDQYGVQFSSQAGQYWFVMEKKHFQAVRISIGSHGVDYNFRVSYNNWEALKQDYDFQISNAMPWDDK